MRLKAISIKNYRSLVDIPWVEIGPLTVLIGKNNSGKSTFLEAVSAIHGGLSRRFSTKNHVNKTSFICYELEDLQDYFKEDIQDKFLIYKVADGVASVGATAETKELVELKTTDDSYSFDYVIRPIGDNPNLENKWLYFLSDAPMFVKPLYIYQARLDKLH